MENEAVTLYCPNQACLAVNPLNHKFCQRCSTPLPRRYLWAVGDSLTAAKPGDVLGDRYLVINQSVVLDRKPGLLPQSPAPENLEKIKAYLRLIPYRLNVPQVYGILTLTEGESQQYLDRAQYKEILLLEQPPLTVDNSGLQVQLCTQLNMAWADATSMRQLNWLWQIANLWQPLKTEGVATSLIDPHVLRVEGPLVRLLDLRFDHSTSPSLHQLGEFWQTLELESKPAIAQFVHEISRFLIQGKIDSPEVLILVLDQGLATLARSQTATMKTVTKTDTGPSRQRNEDACYPASGTVVSSPPQTLRPLAIVCDGIGGHEGGNVASNLAIETIHQQLQELIRVPDQNIEPSLVLTDLDQAVAIANDKISGRNDSENRQARQRMGTTVVMALPMAHEMYITHVGDSRAYWITRQGCYQVTLDDDVASREVRLGYGIYRQAVQQGAAGSLLQALGMSASNLLHPTSQRFIIDEDAIFLLASDGLTDYDRVEDYWETEILPILTGENDIVQVADKLVELANTKNGHDNVTLALIHQKIKYCEPQSTIKPLIPDISSIIVANTVTKALQPQILENSDCLHGTGEANRTKTKVIPETQPTRIAKLPLHFIVPFSLVVLAGSLGYWVMEWRSPIRHWRSQSPSDPTPIKTIQPTVTTPVTNSPLDNLSPGGVIETLAEISLQSEQTLPPKSLLEVLEVIDIKSNLQPETGDVLVNLRLCTPNTTNSPNQPLPPIKLSQLQKFPLRILPSNQKNLCNSSSNPTSPANKPIDAN